MNRRVLLQTIAAGMSARVSGLSSSARHLKIGYTCITWGAFPRGAEGSATLEPAMQDIASLGFYSFETFPEILDDWDAKGARRKLIDQYQLPLRSGYCRTILTDASKRKESVEQVIKLGKTIKKYGGTFGVIAPNSVKRESYSFKEYRANADDAARDCQDQQRVSPEAGIHVSIVIR